MSDTLQQTVLPLGLFQPEGVTVADLNDDGRPDLLISGADLQVDPSVPQPGSVEVVLNDGAGFLPATEYRGLDLVGLGNLNGDGAPDIVQSVSYDYATYTDTLAVRLNDGSGTFGPPVALTTSPGLTGNPSLEDVNGDGLSDLVSGRNYELGLGGERFGPATALPFQLQAVESITPADLSGGNQPDLVVHQNVIGLPTDIISILDSDGDGQFRPGQTIYAPGFSGLAVADVTGDGRPDIILATPAVEGGTGVLPQQVRIYAGDGHGGVSAEYLTVDLPNGIDSYFYIATADVFGTGRQDIIVGGSNSFVVLRNTGHGFEAGPAYSLPPGFLLQALTAADLQGTGHADIILVEHNNLAPFGTSAADVVIASVGDETACFCSETRILTASGEVAVETLQEGDEVLALLGGGAPGYAPVRWIGHRRLDLRAHPRPWLVQPIRVLAGAFGPGRPRRNLRVSPGHAIYVDGVLIKAESLVNGATVVQEDQDTATYWHVELDRHDVLLAEGLAAESYLDTGNRRAFANGSTCVELHPDFAGITAGCSCAPLVEHGAALQAVKQALLDRACSDPAHRMTPDAEMRLRVDGRMVLPLALGGQRYQFDLEHPCSDLWLTSRVWVPRWMLADSTDARLLGLCVRQLLVDEVEIALDDGRLSAGWYPEESDTVQGVWRWTKGLGQVPPARHRVVVELGGGALYWPERAAVLRAFRGEIEGCCRLRSP